MSYYDQRKSRPEKKICTDLKKIIFWKIACNKIVGGGGGGNPENVLSPDPKIF